MIASSLCAAIPICGALFVSNLDTILQFTGSIGLFMGFLFPALLEFFSKKMCEQIFDETDAHITPYTTWFCNDFWVGAGFLIVAFLFCVTLYTAITNVI